MTAELAALDDPRIRAVNQKHGDDHGVNLTGLRALAKRLGHRPRAPAWITEILRRQQRPTAPTNT